ncbi:MAG TPA: choice-of-anchor tandem repeat GloVer-containing protein [Terriglobales bacterium]|nr:choice-of-anchor tandem repeat GloVer-containing protein [Terriglobales bacterium]
MEDERPRPSRGANLSSPRCAHPLALIPQHFSQPNTDGEDCPAPCYDGRDSETTRHQNGGTTLTKILQQRISRITAATAVLAFAGLLVLFATQPAPAQTLKALYSFTNAADGGDPFPAVIRDAAGNLYGTTDYAGKDNAGVVFEVSPPKQKGGKWTETVLYTFCSVSGCTDGQYPYAPLVRDAAGNLYGTTQYGGTSNLGVVFKLSATGTETVLHSFTGGADGVYPYSGLFRDSAGNLYGTTESGGTSNLGVVFKMSKAGKETVLHSFTGAANDGGEPTSSGFYMDAKSNLYSVASHGGTSGEGVLYKLSPRGKLTVLHSFTAGTTDGCYPYGTPAVDTLGNMYGATGGCGTSNMGLVWKVSKNGTETVLHNFAGASDGQSPLAGVIVDAAGNIYGSTNTGGASGFGTAFELDKNGKLTLLHTFTGGTDGKYLNGGLILDPKGRIYGTTINGGTGGYGTVWRITK